ncbi:hypothetical protein [Micromonospora sp. NBC_00421]|uniref:hypothetical protein n=1 Tax=Micromonospora sp. NBC_00421 TaxID=2975976 RepID=UPI002E216414
MSSARKQGRRSVHFLASWAAVDAIEQRARDEGIVDEDGEPNRSEMIRMLLAYALRNWQKGWRP